MRKVSFVLLLYATVAVAALPWFLHAETVDVSVEVRFFECNDSEDNDADGFIDFPDDPDCDSATDDNETADTFACNDGVDNDNDGITDYPDDPGCSSETDDSEEDLVSSGTGGGGVSVSRTTLVDFFGFAHPSASVVLLHDGTLVETTTADADSAFHVQISLRATGLETFSLYAVDPRGLRTSYTPLTLNIAKTASVVARDIFIAPTLSLRIAEDATRSLVASGYSMPDSNLQFRLTPPLAALPSTSAGGDGVYRAVFPSALFRDRGPYSVTVFATAGGLISPQARARQFFFEDGAFTLLPRTGEEDVREILIGDLNGDGRVDLVDFSILLFWFEKETFPPRVDLNSDNTVDLVDFSILAFYWTG